MGTAVAQWLNCCGTNRKVSGSIQGGVIGIFHWQNPTDRTMALGSTQPRTEMTTKNISKSKVGRCVRLTTLTPSCVVMKSGNLNFLEPSGPLLQTGPETHPASRKMGTGSFRGVKCGRGLLLNTHPLLVPRSWKSRDISLPTLRGHTGHVTGSLYLYIYIYIYIHICVYIYICAYEAYCWKVNN